MAIYIEYQKTINAMKQMVKKGVVPGISYAIIDHHQIMANIIGDQEWVPYRKPLLDNQIYDLASLTKVVGTVPVILQLVQQHLLKINDSISKYLPEWKYPQVTVRHLLTHTSGIAGWIPHRNQLPPKKMLKAMLGLHINQNFDRKMVYSDTNFIFLGLIAKRITGKPIHQLITQMVLKPLDMTSSGFNPVDKKRCVPTEVMHGKLLKGTPDDPKAQILGPDCGSAGLFSTVSDLIKYCQAILYPQTDPAVLTPRMTNELFHDHTYHGSLGRSYGWAVRHKPHFYIYQSGYTGTGIAIQPDRQRAFIFLSNRVHPKRPNIPFLAYRKHVVETFISEK
ncbi:serine hydrolase domain-containing protein [Acetilactobacillus jinshanensis]|nr:serine hydrolase domain-containing protein [Acetilactobacillus jinshanensis]